MAITRSPATSAIVAAARPLRATSLRFVTPNPFRKKRDRQDSFPMTKITSKVTMMPGRSLSPTVAFGSGANISRVTWPGSLSDSVSLGSGVISTFRDSAVGSLL